jgi:hypothetical protein
MPYPGRFLGPSEIEMLAQVYQTVCKERGVSHLSQEGERLASRLLKLFMNGLTGEDELLDAERNRARRPNRSFQQVSAGHAGTREAA